MTLLLKIVVVIMILIIIQIEDKRNMNLRNLALKQRGTVFTLRYIKGYHKSSVQKKARIQVLSVLGFQTSYFLYNVVFEKIFSYFNIDGLMNDIKKNTTDLNF